MKQRIRLTEGEFHRIIKKCVNETIEMSDNHNKAFDDFEDAYSNGDYERCKQVCEYIDAYGLWGSLERMFWRENLEDMLDEIILRYYMFEK